MRGGSGGPCSPAPPCSVYVALDRTLLLTRCWLPNASSFWNLVTAPPPQPVSEGCGLHPHLANGPFVYELFLNIPGII